MKVTAFSIKPFEKESLVRANLKRHDITFISNRLTSENAYFAEGKDAVLVFTGDDLSEPVIKRLSELGVKYIATRSTGIDHISLASASKYGLKVANVPSYSPESIAEHAMTLLLALCRNLLPAHAQMMEYNFTLERLVGTTIKDKTIGIVGFGETGKAFARILKGFGARILVTDIADQQKAVQQLGAEQVSMDELLAASDVISFHVPLNESTHHMVNRELISKMKDGVILINVARGAIFDSWEVLAAINEDKISKVGCDVYEFESGIFFHDWSKNKPNDQLLKAFIQHSRILITPHQAFLTKEAIDEIARRTIKNLDLWQADKCVGSACCCEKDCAVVKPLTAEAAQ